MYTNHHSVAIFKSYNLMTDNDRGSMRSSVWSRLSKIALDKLRQGRSHLIELSRENQRSYWNLRQRVEELSCFCLRWLFSKCDVKILNKVSKFVFNPTFNNGYDTRQKTKLSLTIVNHWVWNLRRRKGHNQTLVARRLVKILLVLAS